MQTVITEPDGRLVLQEANHRFMNTLTTLGGLLRSDFGDFADPAVREAVRTFSSRIQAFAGVHRTLAQSSGEALVDASDHLANLCAQLCAAQLAPRGLRCEFRSDAGLLPRETCRTLSLIVVELVTNAAKHAFAGRRSGCVRISLLRGERAWICQVADNGAGLRRGPGGHGMTLVQGLARSLGAAVRVHSDASGVTVSLNLPDDPRRSAPHMLAD